MKGKKMSTPAHSSQPAPGPAPAAWYPDPHNQLVQRWWDGHQWTQYTHPPTDPLGHPQRGSLYNGARDAAAGKNSAGTWALVVGVLSVLTGIPRGLALLSVALGVAAIVWGGVGLARAARFGVRRGAAIAGLVLGILTVLLTLVWLAVL